VVKIAIGGGGQLKGTEADIIEGLVIKGEALIGVLDELVNRECAIVGLNNGIRHLGGRDDRVGGHDSIGVFLTNLKN
jgi:hypothetical protein